MMRSDLVVLPEPSIVNDRLYIKSKAEASSYIGESELSDSDGWVDTGDLVRVEQGRFLSLFARTA